MAKRGGNRRFRVLVSAFAALAAGFAAAASAETFTAFPIPGSVIGLAAGPDGNLWYVGNRGRIGRMTMAGDVTEFSTPDRVTELGGIAAGPDGNLWFTEVRGAIGRISTAGVVTEFSIPTTDGFPLAIAAGPDGNVWFTERSSSRIGRITPAGVITEFTVTHADPSRIAAGSDGHVWFSEYYGAAIGRIDAAGHTRIFSIRDENWAKDLSLGADGNLWFTEAAPTIGRITPAGAITEFPVPSGAAGSHIVAGPDGNLWFTEDQTERIGRISPDGVVTEIPISGGIGAPSGPLVLGPDRHVWLAAGNQLVRITSEGTNACVPDATTLCLRGGRFAVTTQWIANGTIGSGQAVAITPDAGYFTFFGPNNVEIVVKVLNGCSINSHTWVFAAGLTNVYVVLTVVDVETGAARSYSNSPGTPFPPILDTGAFASCP
ncbi:MAG: hypothetical protein ABI592_02125 [Acidobacteriota bacterium]